MTNNWKLEVRNWKLLPGFTLAELLVTMFIFVTLVGIATISLTGARQRTSLNTTLEILVGDMKHQQLRSMVGDTHGGTTPDTYGIHFNTANYVLFQGTTYSAVSPTNFTVNLGDSIQIIGTPSDIVYQRVSGEVTAAGSIQVQDIVGKAQKTLQFNRYGVVTAIN